MTGLPRWLGPRRLGLLAAIVIAAAGGIVAYDRYVINTLKPQVTEQLAASSGVRAALVRSWATTRRSEAELFSTILATKPASLRTARDADTLLLRAIVAQGQFESGWILDRSGTVIAVRTRDAEAPAIGLGGRSASFSPLPGDSATTRVALVDGNRAVVDFAAPVRAAGGPLGWVILRAQTGLSQFPYLGLLSAPMSAKTEHSALIAPAGDGAIVLAFGVRTPGDTVRRILTLKALPDWSRAAMATGQNHGTGVGLFGPEAVHGATAVPGLGWIVMRDVETSELRGTLTQVLWINDGIFTLIVVLLVVSIAAFWRTGYLRRANEVAQLRSDFVSSVSHELRTPLTQIRMYAEMLRGGLLREPAETERALGVIEKESERLSMLVDRTLNFARPPRSLPTGNTPPIDVADGIREALAAFAPLAAERGAQVVVEVTEKPRARIERDALQQILLNLLENAVKYGPRGQTIRVGARESAGATQIWVGDEGPGVAAAERETIWGAFQRGRAADGSDTNGSGIGLAVVRELATQFGGSASVEPANGRNGGRGAHFVILLPGSAPSDLAERS